MLQGSTDHNSLLDSWEAQSQVARAGHTPVDLEVSGLPTYSRLDWAGLASWVGGSPPFFWPLKVVEANLSHGKTLCSR